MDSTLQGLVIKRPWIDLILDGKKTWEIRSRRATVRDVVALIEGGSGKIVAVARLTACIGPLPPEELPKHFDKHLVSQELMGAVPYDEFYAWELRDVRRLNPPIAYNHPSGAVIWVRLNDETVGDGLRRLLEEASQLDAGRRRRSPLGIPAATPRSSKLQRSAARRTTKMRSRVVATPIPPAANDLRGGAFDAERAAALMTALLKLPPDSTLYAHRWNLADGVGIGIDRRGSRTVTAFCGAGIDLAPSGLAVARVKTQQGTKYGINSNMKHVAGCEPGNVVQRITLRNVPDVEALVRHARAAL